MERPFLSSKVYISFWTTSVVSPTERTNSSVCSKVGVRISPKPCRPAMRISVSSIYRIRALWSGVKSCVPRGALVISAIVFPTSLPLWFDRRFDMKKLRPLASRLVPENARDGENSVVPPLLNRLYGHSSGSTREIPLTREGFGPVSSLGRTSRLIGCPSSRVRSQTAFSRGGPSLVRSPGILLPF